MKKNAFPKCTPEECNVAKHLEAQGKNWFYNCKALLKSHNQGNVCMKARL